MKSLVVVSSSIESYFSDILACEGQPLCQRLMEVLKKKEGNYYQSINRQKPRMSNLPQNSTAVYVAINLITKRIRWNLEKREIALICFTTQLAAIIL